MINIESLRSQHSAPFPEFERSGYLSLEIAKELVGRKLDDQALAFLSSYRPSSIRVTTGAITDDFRLWRVTVYVDSLDRIHRIIQEVAIGLPDGIPHGHAFRVGFEYGFDSKEFKTAEKSLLIINSSSVWERIRC